MRAFFFYIKIAALVFVSSGAVAQENVGKTLKDVGDTAIIQSIQQAITYLQDPKTEVYFPDYAVYTYLQKRFNAEKDTILPDIRSAAQIETQLILDKKNPESFLPFVRLAPNIKLKCVDWRQRIAHYNGIDSFTIRALYADSCTINKSFLRKLANFAALGDYELTHAYLALIWLGEHRHRICKTAFYKKMYADFETKIVAFLQNKKPNEWYDIHSEALALLAYKNGLKYFKNEYINAAIQAQTPEGAWQTSAHDAQTSAHAAALTLWLLCEKMYPRTTYPNWIMK